MAMEIEKESERVDLLRIGDPHRRVGWAGRVHRAPPDARELGKLSGSGSPAIVAMWFAWWYLRPARNGYPNGGCKIAGHGRCRGGVAVRRRDSAAGWWIRGSVLAGACYG